MILGLVDEAVAAGSTQSAACELLGIDRGTLRRWLAQDIGDDRREGPKSEPSNKLSEEERSAILEKVNEPEFRDLSVNQIVPRLADLDIYLASESTIRRILADVDMNRHREPCRPPNYQRPRELVATRPNQVWSWDITYLRGPVCGKFFFLYLVMDVWSRKIVGFDVHHVESGDLAKDLIRKACDAEKISPNQLALHQDNGAPMKHGNFKALLESLGVIASYSRPSVSDDNPFIEALFRTMKYRPGFPNNPFVSIADALAWVEKFVAWYNTEHRHSHIRFVTPDQRHRGDDKKILANRTAVYNAARKNNPMRWSKGIRDWSHIDEVVLNPAAPAKDKHVAA